VRLVSNKKLDYKLEGGRNAPLFFYLINIRMKHPQSQKDKVAAPLAKEYTIVDPDGNVFNVVNLTKWCKENNLDQDNMVRVANGKAKQHKGYLVNFVT